jgi:hypothetical protein
MNEKLKILLESVKDKYDFVADADNTLDGKAAALMGFEITLFIGYLSLVIAGIGDSIKFGEGVAGLVGLGVSIALLLRVNWPKQYTAISVDLFEHQDYLSKTEDDLLLQLVSDAQNAFTENNKTLGKKAKLYKIAIALLIISSVLLVLSKVAKFYV